MKAKYVFCLIPMILFSCKEKDKAKNAMLFSKNNLVAWCIVPFDSMNRTPEQRAAMLYELGIKNEAYDWRENHLSSFPYEVRALKNYNIGLKSVWMWIDADSGNMLDESNEQLLSMIEKARVATDIWLGFGHRYFEGLTDEQKLEKAVTSVQYIHDRAKKLNCTVSLYNHGDWFGEPLNQVSIIEKSGLKDIGIIYNFHHAHAQINEYPELLNKMLPYLRTVNINGMKIGGPQILPLGQGDHELEMLKTLKASGYNGSIGILGHIENEDVKTVLERNLEGLKSLLNTLGDDEALATY